MVEDLEQMLSAAKYAVISKTTKDSGVDGVTDWRGGGRTIGGLASSGCLRHPGASTLAVAPFPVAGD